jgi:hypothetical protein
VSDFVVTIKDGHDRLSDFGAAYETATRLEIVKSQEFAKKLRQHHWDTRRITGHGTYYGGEEYQWLAHVSGPLAEILDTRFPGWDSDEKILTKAMQEFPSIKVNPSI